MKSRIRLRIVRALITLGCGGAMTQLSCNPNVRDVILQGLETTSTTFANTLIQALFDGLGDGEASATP